MHHHPGFKKIKLIIVLNHFLSGYQYNSDPLDIVESFTKEIKIGDKFSREKHKLQMFLLLQGISNYFIHSEILLDHSFCFQ